MFFKRKMRGFACAPRRAAWVRASLLVAVTVCCPIAASAQASGTGMSAYCSVEDTGGHQIWVSQVFPAPPSAGAMALDLASEFHAYVATLGGAGNKQCVVASRAEAEATRAKVAEIMGKRVLGMRVYRWHDVEWTPSAATYAGTQPVQSASPMQYVYCRLTDVDTRTQVTSNVAAVAFPRADNMAHFAALEHWAKSFGAQAAASYQVDPSAQCIASDTAAEAEKSLTDYRHLFRFTGIKRVELPWVPDAVEPAAPLERAEQPSATTASGDDVEAELWRRIATSKLAADYEDYLAAFPQGRHAPIARVEARRLGGHAGGGATPAPAPSDIAPPAGSMMSRVATEPFFQLPAATTGVSVERSGTRTIGTTAVATTLRVQRAAGSNVCRTANVSKAGAVATRYEGVTWAGLLPLDGTISSQSPYGSNDYTVRVTSIDSLEGQPFPLVEGHAFGYTFTQLTTDAGTTHTANTTSYRCVVGRLGPASALVPGLAGDETEVQCTVTFKDLALPPKQQVLHWYSAAGCFVQDPGR